MRITKIIDKSDENPIFDDVKEWYENNLSPDKINFDDPKPYEVYEYGRWAGIFQLSSVGSQRLFAKSKPKSITDIATLTSIYRPGPLAANLDKLYLEVDQNPYDWGDQRINKILTKTKGLLIFQEQVMELAEKCAGFPKEQCDEVRRAIMKRSISGGEAAKHAANDTRDSFVKGCIQNGYTSSVANNLYDKILYFAGYGFNAAHAHAYAIDSFWCAWLMTYHEEQWLCSYLESMSNSPDQRIKAFGEVKSLGYQIVPIDINYAAIGWTSLPGKKLMPSMTSCKGLGAAAVEEIMQNRPYNTIEELLWDDDFQWRHSKFNKKALDMLIKTGAFHSMDIIGEDKLFKNYHHMYKTILGSHVETVTRKRKGIEVTEEVEVDHLSLIKRSPRSDPYEGLKNFYELLRRFSDTPEWTPVEKAQNMVEVFGTLDVTALMDQELLRALESKSIPNIDDLEYGDPTLVWFVAAPAAPKKGAKPISGVKKKTKNGKDYVQIFGVGPTGKAHRISVWGGKDIPEPFTVFCAELKKDEFGMSTTQWKLKKIS